MSTPITEGRNARSLQADNQRFDIEINHPQHGWIPYTIDPSDGDATIDNAALLELIGTDFEAYVAPTQAEIDAADSALLAKRISRLSCTKMQGILTLGETKWGKVLAYRDHADTTWAQKMVIDSAQNWQRTSENIKFIGYLIGFNDDQMDAMFIKAAKGT